MVCPSRPSVASAHVFLHTWPVVFDSEIPQTVACQAPLPMGFSRQEYWRGLPFPSPMHESESEREVAQSCPTLVTPWTAAYQAPPFMGFSRQEYWSGLPLM